MLVVVDGGRLRKQGGGKWRQHPQDCAETESHIAAGTPCYSITLEMLVGDGVAYCVVQVSDVNGLSITSTTARAKPARGALYVGPYAISLGGGWKGPHRG